MMSDVRVRTAPSPTGIPHIGNTWTALINYIFAKKNNGKFILRLEDTDRERLVKESESKLFETLHWLGLDYDEGPDKGGPHAPYTQSQRLSIYKKYSQELLEKGLAYKEDEAIRFKTQKDGQTSWHDLVGDRQIAIPNNTQEDFVILKSDGYPTYNFANVIDDHLMEITHVIRGNEFISSTPKHLMLYQALGWEPPQFAHLPVLVGADRAKLSKRHGAKSALEFKEEGFLPEALINFLAMLGWSHPEQKDIFDLNELISLFDLKDINNASPFFDVKKLEWINGEYIRKMDDVELAKRLKHFLADLSEGAISKKDHPTEEEIEKVVPLIKERIKKLSDLVPLTDFLWEAPEYEREVFEKVISEKGKGKSSLEKILENLDKLDGPWKAVDFEQTFRTLAEDLGISVTQIFQLIRVAVSGQLVTPPLFESIQILGEDQTKKRVQKAIEFLR